MPARFIHQRSIAEGGMALVNLVWDRSAQEWRALKTLKPELAGRSSLLERFEREGRTMMQIAHPNVVHVYDIVRAHGTVHLVMEYAEAGSITEWLERHGSMTPCAAIGVVLQLCSAIEAAHALGIVHRDVKPHNLVIDRHGTVKLTDFGIAHAADLPSHTLTGSAMGTLGYMAPEQHASAKHADARADVYAIAVTLYTLLRGQPTAHLFMADEDDFQGIHPVLVEVIRKGGEYDREARFQTVRAMGQALERVLRHLPPDPEGAPKLVPWDVRLTDDLPSPEVTVGPEVTSISVLRTAPTRPVRTASSFPSREAIASPRRSWWRSWRTTREQQQRRLTQQRVLVAALAATALLAIGVLAIGVVGQVRLDQAAVNLRVADEEREQTLREHTRFILSSLAPAAAVAPMEVRKLEGLLRELSPLEGSPVRTLARTERDEMVWSAVDLLQIVTRRMGNTADVGALRRLETAADDLGQDCEAYERARRWCEEMEGGSPARIAASLRVFSGRCLVPTVQLGG